MWNGRLALCIWLVCLFGQSAALAPHFSEDWYGFTVADGARGGSFVGSLPTSIHPLLHVLYSVGICGKATKRELCFWWPDRPSDFTADAGNDYNRLRIVKAYDYSSRTVVGYIHVAPYVTLKRSVKSSYKLLVTVSNGLMVGTATVSVGVGSGSGAATVVPMCLVTLFSIGIMSINL